MQTATWWSDSTGTPEGWDTGWGDVCTARREKKMKADSGTYVALRWLTGTLRWDSRGETLNCSATLTFCPLLLGSWPAFAGSKMFTGKIFFYSFTCQPSYIQLFPSPHFYARFGSASEKDKRKFPNFDNYQKDLSNSPSEKMLHLFQTVIH